MVEPALLVWARGSIGLTVAEAAKKVAVTPERVEQWESGEARPTIAQLRALAAAYKRPLAVFYLPEPPMGFQALRDFRRLPDAEVGSLSPALHGAIQRAHAVREAAVDLRAIAGEEVAPSPTVPAGRDAEQFGLAARELLDVEIGAQVAWTDPGRALTAWIDALSERDVLVLQVQSIPITEMRGFSLSADRMPVVVLNGADSPRGRIFTLLHEFIHVLLGAEGVCDLHTARTNRTPSDDVEIFCNQAAASALMPAALFGAEPKVLASGGGDRWSPEDLAALSERYSVSQEAVLRRLYSLGLTSWEFLQERTAEFRAAYDEAREELKRRRAEAEKPGGPTYYRMKVRDLGRPFISLALDAYYRREITGVDLFEFLEIKISQIPKLEEELALTADRP
ncbi:MAG: XRE family transcriptional regulator [Solirubrobacteraceae bacterium]